jgi:hypothetical protein
MKRASLPAEQVEILEKLARGIIPADGKDQGVAGLNVGQSVARKIESDPNGAIHLEGLNFAASVAQETFGRPIIDLDPTSIHELVGMVRESFPGLFKLLRTEACAIYLSQPAAWKRIGFPGPSIEQGGYPEFDKAPSPKT